MVSEMTGRITYLDCLRTGAMLYIVAVHHVLGYTSDVTYTLNRLLYYDVIDDILTICALGLFVFLSGYLLAPVPITNLASVGHFYKKRLIRIYPLYLAALFLFILVLPLDMTTVNLVLHVAVLNMLTGNSIYTLWFVSMICLFYLLLPGLVWRYSPMRTLLTTLGIWTALFVLHTRTGAVDARMLLYLPLFSFGIVSARQKWLPAMQRGICLVTAGGCCILAVILLLIIPSDSTYRLPVQSGMAASSMPVLLFLGRTIADRIPTSICRHLAYASFCMYLLHRIVFYLLLELYHPPGGVITVLYLALFAVPLCYALSSFLQRTYDRFIAGLFAPSGIR